MILLRRLFLIPCFAVLAISAQPDASAEKNADIELRLGEVGASFLEQSFDGELPAFFKGVKGEWKVVDGAVKGVELASDKHAAVLNVQKANRDSVVRTSFRFDGTTKGFNFSLNHKGGHLFRVIVSPTAVRVSLDKDKKDPKSKAVSLGMARAKFKAGTWYTLQVEMKGEQVVAQTDNGVLIEVSHAKLDTNKPNYRFVMKGDSLMIDDLTAWEWK